MAAQRRRVPPVNGYKPPNPYTQNDRRYGKISKKQRIHSKRPLTSDQVAFRLKAALLLVPLLIGLYALFFKT